MKSVLDDRSVEGMRWRGEVVVRRRDGDQAASEANASAQPAGVSSLIALLKAEHEGHAASVADRAERSDLPSRP